jgi:hypothetical protein
MRSPFVRLSTLAAVLTAVAVAVPAQVAAHDVAAWPPAEIVPGRSGVFDDRLLVKVVEGSGAEWRSGVLVSRTGVDLGALRPWFARAQVEPMIPSLSWDELDRWHRRAADVLPAGRRPGHLGLWFRLRTATPAVAAELLAALRVEPLVAHVHYEGIPVPASCRPQDIPPPTPLYTNLQLPFGPSPTGHGIRSAAGVLGARGQRTAARMVEETWILDHEDVPGLVAANFIGPVPSSAPTSASNHGVAGTSILAAGRNGYGITGICDEVDLRFVSWVTNVGIDNAMMVAANACQPGDVVVLVMMFLLSQVGTQDWVPFEFLQSTFDTTLTITANGRLVVAAGGNGANNLDDPRLMRRFDRGFRDSGAILVGASAGGALQRATFSNWGSRIDANSWGEGVVVAGYGTLFFPNLDYRQAYTANGTGTSSATPHVAGIVTSLQGAARRQLGRSLTNGEMRQALHTHGTPLNATIGLRPDLVAAFHALGILDGLQVAAPDAGLGVTVPVTMSGPAGSLGFLFVSFGTDDVPFGLNRNLHLSLATLQTIGFFPLTTGSATWPLVVPNFAGLQGTSLFFQAARLEPGLPLHVTNSCQVTVL